MGKMLIKKWAETHDKTELLAHIECAVPGYANVGLYVENIFYDEKRREVSLCIEPTAGRHASHLIGGQVLFHGGHVSLLIDVASCALAFTMCDERHIPVTRDMDVKYTGAGMIGAGTISVTCHVENDDDRDIIISAKCVQGDRSMAEGLVTISRTPIRVLGRIFRELVQIQKA